MAESVSQNVGKKLIQIDISSDTVCPWCFVGKKNLDKAMAIAKNQYDFEVFRGLGLEYSLNGLIGNTLDSHRLIFYAGQKAPEMQHNLVEELCLGYFTQGKSIGDREFLLEAARKLEGAAEFLEDPNNGLQEVQEELAKYSSRISGVPHYLIDGKYELSGAQSPEVFLGAFEAAAKGK
ncbi:hypothetical protein CRG98_024260 [Punica granatum]|uniref:DSBA-like thioredoxin domain-containing protein n=1 Tax=Punica granatum TaxID=22663 RepID=A0A2I0JHE9_PUNGR|nr:hypothetical protein CRG98_024260 [Punica granatum]